VIIGTGVAAGYGKFSAWRAALALIVALALQIGVNYANDFSDGIRGSDERRVGPTRLVAAGLAPPRQVLAAAFGCFFCACVAGLVLALATSWWLILVGAAAVAAAWFYTGGRHPYGYHGLGEVAVFAFFGLAAVAGTAYVQMSALSWLGLVAAVPAGLLSCALLMINNLRDIRSDAEVGKRTLAITPARPLAALTVAALPLARDPVRAVRSGATGPALIKALGQTGRLQLAFGAALTIGLAIHP
jgi:1,4-dihydroxy-2-naphthoate octaprenyltransferase